MLRILLLSIAYILPLHVALAAEDVVFAKGSEWEVVSTGHKFAEGMAWDTEGHFFFDVPRNQLFRVDAKTGKKTLFDGDTGETNGIALAPDGRIYGRPRCNYVRISPDSQWIYTAYRDDLLRRRLVDGLGQH